MITDDQSSWKSNATAMLEPRTSLAIDNGVATNIVPYVSYDSCTGVLGARNIGESMVSNTA